MARGLSKRAIGKGRHRSLFIVVALLLTTIASIIIAGVVMTISSSNQLMNLDKKEIANIPSNIFPSYTQTNFTSFDGHTALSGWYFTVENPKSTIILVHDVRKNRLQFDISTSELLVDMLGEGFNVFLFDQRNAGDSEGDKTGYGYLEWKDLVGAIAHVRDITTTKNVILYGVGNGCSTILQAAYNLPGKDDYNKSYDSKTNALLFDRSYIIGMILDSPAKMSDDYIVPFAKNKGSLGWLMQYTVPYAIRITTSGANNMNLMSAISQTQIPICILYGDRDTFIGAGTIGKIVEERERLHPNTTMSFVFPDAKYTESFESDPAGYRRAIRSFLSTYFYS